MCKYFWYKRSANIWKRKEMTLKDKFAAIKSVKPELGLKKKMEYLKNLKKKRFNKRKK